MSQRARLGRAAYVALFALGSLCAWACSQTEHLFRAREYDVTNDCVRGDTVLDVVEGDEPGFDCAAVCLLVATVDAGLSRFVSSECGNRPLSTIVAATDDATCNAALAAFARRSVCLSDGGVSNPLPDASVGDGAAVDRALDAAFDAGD